MAIGDSLRRLYNQLDLLFDRRAITQERRLSYDGAGSNRPATASQALKAARPFVFAVERRAQLKMIVSPDGAGMDGTSARWEFFFDLPHRRAKLSCDWLLTWDESGDDYKPARIDIVVRPFPPENSLLRKAVKEGKLLHQQVASMWKQEIDRLQELPDDFRDSDVALADFRNQGLDPAVEEYSLTTGRSPQGHLCWIAQTRDSTYYAPMTGY